MYLTPSLDNFTLSVICYNGCHHSTVSEWVTADTCPATRWTLVDVLLGLTHLVVLFSDRKCGTSRIVPRLSRWWIHVLAWSSSNCWVDRSSARWTGASVRARRRTCTTPPPTTTSTLLSRWAQCLLPGPGEQKSWFLSSRKWMRSAVFIFVTLMKILWLSHSQGRE